MTAHTVRATAEEELGGSETPQNARMGMFSSLAIHNYRLFFVAMLISNTGLWMSRVAQDWLVLVILTPNSATALGLVTAIQFLPIPLLAPVAGAVADRFDKRRLLLVTQSCLAAVAVTLAALVLSGHVQLWQVYALAFIQGCANAIDNPSRQSFVSEMVPSTHLTNAVGLNSITFHASRLLGPAIAGVTIAAWSVGPALAFNALSFAAIIVALAVMRTGELTPAPVRRGRGSIREGFAYVRRRPDLQLIMFLAFMLGTFGMNFQITNALMATQVFHVGPEGYGLLGSIMAIGSLTGGLLAARRSAPRLRTLLLALGGFAVSMVAAALSPSYLVFAALLIPTGLFSLTAMTTANAAVQLSTDAGMRGRVMALYLAIFMGGTPLGSPIVGWIGDAFGARWTLLVGAIAVGLSVLVAVAYEIRTGQWTPRRRRADQASSSSSTVRSSGSATASSTSR